MLYFPGEQTGNYVDWTHGFRRNPLRDGKSVVQHWRRESVYPAADKIPQMQVDYGHLDFRFWRDHQDLECYRSKSFYIIEGRERATEAAVFRTHTCSPIFIN